MENVQQCRPQHSFRARSSPTSFVSGGKRQLIFSPTCALFSRGRCFGGFFRNPIRLLRAHTKGLEKKVTILTEVKVSKSILLHRKPERSALLAIKLYRTLQRIAQGTHFDFNLHALHFRNDSIENAENGPSQIRAICLLIMKSE